MSAISLRSTTSFEPSPTPEKNNKVVKLISKPDSDVVVEGEKEKEYIPLIPFPHIFVRTKNLDDEDRDKEILDVFRKVAVNIPLLYVTKQVPK